MIVALEHIAIAVPSLEKSIHRLAVDLDLACESRSTVKSESVDVAMFPLPPTKIELLQSTSDEGPLAKFVQNRGGGLHHLCFRSDNLDDDVKRLKSRGYRFLSDEPFAGADGHRVIFIHPESFDGVLVELSQPV